MKLKKNHPEICRILPVPSDDTRKMAPYTAFSKNNQLSTGPPSNPRVFHLHVNNHCTSQEVDTCALVKIVPMKSWCHI